MSDTLRILYSGNDQSVPLQISAALPEPGATVCRQSLLSATMEELEQGSFEMLLLQHESDTESPAVFARLRQRFPQLCLIAVMQEHNVREALAVLRSGADEIIVLDHEFGEQLQNCVARLLDPARAQLSPPSLPQPVSPASAASAQAQYSGSSLLWSYGICSGLLDEAGRFIEGNPALEQLLQVRPGSLSERHLHDFLDLGQIEKRTAGEIGNAETCFVADLLQSTGRRGRLLVGLSNISIGERNLRLLQARDILDQHRSSVLSESQSRLVEMILAGAELSDILATVSGAVEQIHPGSVCTIQTADTAQGRLVNACSGSMDPAVSALLDEQCIAENASCSGQAAWSGLRVSGTCFSADPEVQRRLHELRFDYAACSAQPVISASGGVLGILTIYLPAGQRPGAAEYQTMEIAANLAGVAMDRIQIEQARVQSDVRYRNLFEQSPLAMQVYAPDGQALRGNRVWQRMFGKRQDQFESYNILEDQRIAQCGLLSYVRRGFAGEATELPLLRGGRADAGPTPLPFLPWTRTFIYCIDDSEGRPGEVILVHEDMSDRRIAEESLRHSEDRLRSLVEGADDLIFTVSRSGILSAINTAFERVTSHSIAAWIGRSPLGLVHPDDRRIVHGLFLEVMRGQLPRELEVRYSCTRDSYRSGSLSAIPIIENGQIRGAFFTLRDDTERRLVEEERLRLLTAIEKVDEMIIITDPAGRMVYVNPAFERISGHSFTDVKHFTARVLRSDEHDDAFFEEMWQQLSAGRVWRGEIVNKAADGSSFRVDAAITPIMSSHGEISNYVGVLRDITLRTLVEQRLQNTQKMEAIGSLAGGIAHDFNNILSAIIGYTQIVKRDVADVGTVQNNLDSVIQASMRASDLVRQILTFSQHRETPRQAVCLHRIVREVLKLIRASLPSTIEIRQSLLDQSGTVIADGTQLHQLVMNLCTNAGQAMEAQGGILEIELNQASYEANAETQQLGIEPGSYMVLRIRDTGTGMDSQTIKRIFEPFFTTKETGQGTGLGLSVVHGIVSKLGGAIKVDSSPGAGSVFSVLLPRSERCEFALPEPDFSDIRGSERILLVDDERIVAEMAQQALTQLGYEVTATTSSDEAFILYSGAPEAFDVLITDQTMPGMTGVQLTQAIHGISPTLPVILCTGFSRTISAEMAEQYGISAFLEKPTSTDRLAATIRQVLKQGSMDRQPQPAIIA
jgi:PAS domain S-box-containing protein